MPLQHLSLLDPEITLHHDAGGLRVYSARYGDVYFSAEDGFAESMAVFGQGAELPQRLAHNPRFAVGELGFGSGLNFCMTLKLFRQYAPPDARLYYFATENAPLDADAMAEILAAFPQIADERQELVAHLPPRWAARHRLLLAGGRVVLDLIYGDSLQNLAVTDFAADAWFLDGFAPARNPDMWQDALFEHIARCSAKGAIVASFSAAGAVRRGLTKAGFNTLRHAGFGAKKHRITAHFRGGTTPSPRKPNVIIIGGGIAGASCAEALQRRGVEAEILESAPILAPISANTASGNPVAIQAPRLTADASYDGWLSLNAFGYARREALRAGAGLDAGVLALAHDARESERQQRLASLDLPRALVTPCTPEEASDLAGIKLNQSALYYPYAGAIDPRFWVKTLLKDVPCRYNITITKISETTSGIKLHDQNGDTHRADAVVLAAGAGLAELWGGRLEPMLPLVQVLGQLSQIPAPHDHPIKMPLSFGGTLARGGDGALVLGATHTRLEHNPTPKDMQVSDKLHHENHARLPEAIKPHLPPPSDAWQGRVSIRAATSDHQPIAGAVGAYLYALGGLGGHGMVSAPLLAESIAADICQDAAPPTPLDAYMRRHSDPFRFNRRAGF